MRVLVTVTPRIYHEAIALSVRRHGLEVRVASQGATGRDLAGFTGLARSQ